MIFRQLFDSVSSTYSYVLASRRGGESDHRSRACPPLKENDAAVATVVTGWAVSALGRCCR